MNNNIKRIVGTSLVLFALITSGVATCLFMGGPLGDCPPNIDGYLCNGPEQNYTYACYTSMNACCRCRRWEIFCDGSWKDRALRIEVQPGYCDSGSTNSKCVAIDPSR